MRIKEFLDWVTLKDLRQGLMLTFRYLWTKPVTHGYPYEEFTADPRWRGLHQLWKDAKTGKERCLCCCLCERICPNGAIKLTTRPAADGGKEMVDFVINAGRCMYCGYCQEVCPARAIRLSQDFTKKVHNREDIIFHKEQLLERGGQD